MTGKVYRMGRIPRLTTYISGTETDFRFKGNSGMEFKSRWKFSSFERSDRPSVYAIGDIKASISWCSDRPAVERAYLYVKFHRDRIWIKMKSLKNAEDIRVGGLFFPAQASGSSHFHRMAVMSPSSIPKKALPRKRADGRQRAGVHGRSTVAYRAEHLIWLSLRAFE